MNKKNCNECAEVKLLKKSSWVFRVLVAIDQLGNALADGNPDATISARVGYHSLKIEGYTKYYWKAMEKIINFAFRPLDGDNHCLQAYCLDIEEKYELGSDVARVFLSLLIIPTCVVIALILYPLCLFFPSLKNQYK